ncbi:class I adenylate cyclase [Vibrio cyclitrophicus]|uniref:class I adenylate cyclase n=1 Tax=Vibrio cyclitrophicus TaxID=47951 RepID=UPI0038B37016
MLPGKVTLLNPQISPDLHEPDLSFIEVRQGQANKPGWYLYKQPLIAHRILGQPSLEHHEYLSKLVAWSFFNGLITESTRLHSVVRDAHIDIDKFYQMVSDLRAIFFLCVSAAQVCKHWRARVKLARRCSSTLKMTRLLN